MFSKTRLCNSGIVASFALAIRICLPLAQNTHLSKAFRRLYVHKDIAQEFTEKLKTALSQLKHGDPSQEGVDLGYAIDFDTSERSFSQ